jgi:hypothetical protein
MITSFKLFENKKDYNGIIYAHNSKLKSNSLPTVLYWIYIKDTSDYYNECLNDNSIDAIKNDSYVVGDLLNKLNIEVPYSDTFFLLDANIKEFKRTKAYGFGYVNNTTKLDSEIFLKDLPKSETTEDFNIVDVKKVLINKDGSYYIYADEEIKFDDNLYKYNL